MNIAATSGVICEELLVEIQEGLLELFPEGSSEELLEEPSDANRRNS